MSTAETRIHDAALRIFAERGVTQLTISELAEEAGVARGTVYNNLGSTDALFEQVAAGLADEMLRRIVSSFAEIDDPAHRLANGIRLFVRRAHEEPVWGRFIIRYTFSNDSLRTIWGGAPASDLRRWAGAEALPHRSRPDPVCAGNDLGLDAFRHDVGCRRPQDMARERVRRGRTRPSRVGRRAKGSQEDRQPGIAALAEAFLETRSAVRHRMI